MFGEDEERVRLDLKRNSLDLLCEGKEGELCGGEVPESGMGLALMAIDLEDYRSKRTEVYLKWIL